MSFIVFTTLVVVAGALLDRWTGRDANPSTATSAEAAARTYRTEVR